MKTNEYFNIKRFGTYWVTDLKACINQYGLALLLIGFIGVIAYLIVGIFTLIFSGSWYSIGEVGWLSMLWVGFIILVMSMSVKCYGQITDKRAGSLFLSIPVSTFEKYLSMILNIGIVLPIAYAIIYLISNLLVSFIDHNTIRLIFESNLLNMPGFNEMNNVNAYYDVSYFVNPWTMVDDILAAAYTFLFGAILFKKNKVVYTILCLLALGMVVSSIAGPFFIEYVKDIDAINPSEDQMLLLIGDTMDTMKIIDIISDIVILVGLNIAIFFRLKTLKH